MGKSQLRRGLKEHWVPKKDPPKVCLRNPCMSQKPSLGHAGAIRTSKWREASAVLVDLEGVLLQLGLQLAHIELKRPSKKNEYTLNHIDAKP